MSHRILSWDWREQPDMEQFGKVVEELSGGRVHLHEVNTGSDQYAVVLTDENLPFAEVDAVYRDWWLGEA